MKIQGFPSPFKSRIPGTMPRNQRETPNSRIIVGSTWDSFEIFLGLFWDNLGTRLESAWDHFGMLSVSLWETCGTILESFWDHFEIILKSFWDYFGIIWGSLLDNVEMVSAWLGGGHFEDLRKKVRVWGAVGFSFLLHPLVI